MQSIPQKILEIFNGKFDEFSQSVALNVAAGLIVSGNENDFKKPMKKLQLIWNQEMSSFI